MRILAIGDIHGCSIAFDTLIAAVKPQLKDKIITLGDYIDRGPDSKGIITRLIALHQTGQLTALRGNHELMLLQASAQQRYKKSRWWHSGGDATLASYSKPGKAGKLTDIPDSHWHFIKYICVDWCETNTHFFVHANAFPDVPLADQPDYMLFWEKLGNPMPHLSGKTMVCGHIAKC